VHWVTSGQVEQCSANFAIPVPSCSRRIFAVISAGQITVSRSRSMVNLSFANSPFFAEGGWVLHFESTPAS
jgi:hypothetical protein